MANITKSKGYGFSNFYFLEVKIWVHGKAQMNMVKEKTKIKQSSFLCPMETSDDELIEILSCHRPASCPNRTEKACTTIYHCDGFGAKQQLWPKIYIARVAVIYLTSKASLGPYAWQYKPVKRLKSSGGNAIDVNHNCLPLQVPSAGGDGPSGCDLTTSQAFQDCYLQYDDLAKLPRAQDMFRKVELDPVISVKLPKPGATAGVVLQHAVNLFENLLEKNKPMTFKFGITHDPCVRWHNSVFGYKYSKDPFEKMIVIYAASNPHGPAFLEAALIDRFSSFLVMSFDILS